MLMTTIIALAVVPMVAGVLCLTTILALSLIFPRKEITLKNTSCSDEDDLEIGESMYDPNGNYDWSHIPDNPKIKEADLFE